MLTVAAVVYALIRFPEYKEAGFFRTLGRFSGWYLLGIGLSAVILLPVLIAFLGNARTTSDCKLFQYFLYKKSYYKQIFLQFAGFQKIYKGTNLNYAALGYCAIIALFLKRNKKRFSIQGSSGTWHCQSVITSVRLYFAWIFLSDESMDIYTGIDCWNDKSQKSIQIYLY